MDLVPHFSMACCPVDVKHWPCYEPIHRLSSSGDRAEEIAML